MQEKILLRAKMMRSGGVRLTDQHGRELELSDPRIISYGKEEHVLVDPPEIDMPYEWNTANKARLIFRVSVPLEIEE